MSDHAEAIPNLLKSEYRLWKDFQWQLDGRFSIPALLNRATLQIAIGVL